MKYRKKPIEVEAVQWSGSNWHEVYAFAGHAVYTSNEADVVVLRVKTLEGELVARPGDWVIKGVQGEFYPCKPDIFEATYEPVDGNSPYLGDANA